MKPELYESAPLCLPPMSETHPRSLLGVGGGIASFLFASGLHGGQVIDLALMVISQSGSTP